jgi:hypothetical protein
MSHLHVVQAPGDDLSRLEVHLHGRSLERLRVTELCLILPAEQGGLTEAEAVEWARAEARHRSLAPVGEPRAHRVRTSTVFGRRAKWTWRVAWMGASLMTIA